MNFMQAAMNMTTTDNGAPAYNSTLDSALDIFGQLSAFRDKVNSNGTRNSDSRLIKLFDRAFALHPELAVRLAFYIRDIKQGAGERQTGRVCFQRIESLHPELAIKLIPHIVEMGRWDDLLSFKTREVQNAAYDAIWNAILVNQNALAAKWMPRKGPIANKLIKHAGMTKKEYRTIIVAVDRSVEQLVYAGLYSQINYEHVPAKAIRFHHNRFKKYDGKRYQDYLDSVAKGTSEIKSAGLTPVDVWPSLCQMVDDDTAKMRELQWKALENLIPSGKNILPMIDVSGSMLCSIPGSVDRNCLAAAVMTGMYVSERITGPFANSYLTFSSNPTFGKIDTTTSLKSRIQHIRKADWGMSTDITRAFEAILKVGVNNNVHPNDMPDTILILSDMQFDAATRGSNNTAFNNAKNMFEQAGYELPKIVFWNLNASLGKLPVTSHSSGAALVSGYSPNLLRAVFSDSLEDFSPLNIMMEAIGSHRYDEVGAITRQLTNPVN